MKVLLCLLSLLSYQALANEVEPITPIPIKMGLDKRKVKLGKSLFFDTRLSKNDTHSCASCHQLSKAGTNGSQFAQKPNGALTEMNVPSVFNSAFNFRFFWDGRAYTMEDQFLYTQRHEMNMPIEDLINRLHADKKIVDAFKEIYVDGLNNKTIADAIIQYQKSLITPNSRFDLYLMGNKNSLTNDELKGYQLFKKYGCISCHHGVNIGGNMFQIFGVIGDRGAYFKRKGFVLNRDLGRFNITHKEWDKFVFKVPSLRNVALTAPYFHDGSIATLDQAVDIMFDYQLGVAALKQEKELIVKFLKSLTGVYKEELE